ncbi:diguanylate cyclase [Cellvibrio sp. NN19]|uniref:diguanylate cyclase n=1 Tax=Cellvibrio chitinivorans TaxID=3102792 RepID=UPI002B408636|nr:diguanylate cyclase [Cellvibrio sp. NN19]
MIIQFLTNQLLPIQALVRQFFRAQQRIFIALWIILTSLCAAPAFATEPVIYAWAASMADDKRGHYPIELLKLALAKSGQDYYATPSKYNLSQWRTLRHLQLDKGIDVVWTLSSPEREEELLPIRIPIDRGLLGWRLLLITQDKTQAFAQLDTEAQLKALIAGQGHDWPDFPILRNNGYKVSPSSSYEGLFHMLIRGRIDYFPRSLTEIQPELDMHANMPLAIAPNWVLHYPAPLYFFVRKDNVQLAAAIEQGLEVAIRDGSMRKLFTQHFASAIEQAQLQQRRVLHLQNSLLTPETPLTRSELWFSPEQGF